MKRYTVPWNPAAFHALFPTVSTPARVSRRVLPGQEMPVRAIKKRLGRTFRREHRPVPPGPSPYSVHSPTATVHKGIRKISPTPGGLFHWTVIEKKRAEGEIDFTPQSQTNRFCRERYPERISTTTGRRTHSSNVNNLTSV